MKTLTQLRDLIHQDKYPSVILAGNDSELVQLHLSCAETCYLEQNRAISSWYSAQNPWDDLEAQLCTPDIFAPKKLIKLHIQDLKVLQKKEVQAWFARHITPQTSHRWILVLPQLDKRQRSSAWFKKLSEHSFPLMLWPPEPAQLQAHARQYLTERGYTCPASVAQQLAEQCQYQLAAINQCLQHILLAFPPQTTLSTDDISAIGTMSPQQESYTLIDAALQGKLGAHHTEGTWSLSTSQKLAYQVIGTLRDLLVFSEMQSIPSSKPELQKLIRLWPKKEQNYRSACQRHSSNSLRRLLHQASALDKLIKSTSDAGHVQQQLCRVLLRLSTCPQL